MTRLMLLVALSLTGLLVACGDEGGDTAAEGGGQETVSQEEFTAEATEVCASVNQELAQVSGKEFPTEGATIIEDGLADLEGLTPPSGQEETFDQFIQAGRDAVETLENAGDEPPQQDPFAEFTRLGNELGIEGGCTGAGQGGG